MDSMKMLGIVNGMVCRNRIALLFNLPERDIFRKVK